MNNQTENGLSRKERERLQHRREIMEAAVLLFAQNGFENTKLEEVASLAEFGKGTIYYYFDNKMDLFNSSLEYVIDDMDTFLAEKLEGVERFYERLTTIVNTHFELYRKNGDFLRMFLSQQRIMSREGMSGERSELARKYRKMFTRLVGEMDCAIEGKEIKAGSGERYARYLLGMIHSQIRAVNSGEMSIDEISPDEIIDLFFKGVSI